MPPRAARHPAHLQWTVGTTELQTFIDDGAHPPFRPVLAAVVDGNGLMLGHGVSAPEETEQAVVDALHLAIGASAQGSGSGHTPVAVNVSEQSLTPVVAQLLPGVPVSVKRSPELDAVFEALPSMLNGSAPQGIMALESYLSADVTPEAVASFFAACKDLYEHRPWTLFPDDQCWFSISCQALGMRRWCGSVIGQEGESYGVLLFESQRAQERFFLAASLTGEPWALPPEMLPHQRAISFEPLDSLSRALAAEIQQHNWPVAVGDGYPVPIHLDPDFLYVPTTQAELARLEAVARALTRLIDKVPGLEDYWNDAGQAPLRKQFKLPIQNGQPVSVTITLLPPEDDERL